MIWLPPAQDLKQAFPELGRGLQQLLDIDEDVESMICRNFEVEYDYYGELKKQALKEGGSSIAVNNENRKEFVELYTKWKLHDSISSQFSAFADGFLEVGKLTLTTSTSCVTIDTVAALYYFGRVWKHAQLLWRWDLVLEIPLILCSKALLQSRPLSTASHCTQKGQGLPDLSCPDEPYLLEANFEAFSWTPCSSHEANRIFVDVCYVVAKRVDLKWCMISAEGRD